MFSSLEHKFRTNSSLRAAYSQSTQEYLELGHMRHVSLTNRNVDQYFFFLIMESLKRVVVRLPGCVLSSTLQPQLRVANPFLLVEPNLLTETIDLLTNWRVYPFVFRPASRRCSGRFWYKRKIITYKPSFGEGGDRENRNLFLDDGHL